MNARQQCSINSRTRDFNLLRCLGKSKIFRRNAAGQPYAIFKASTKPVI